MNGHRYLIRLFSGSPTNWLKTDPDLETLAKVFKLSEGEQSVDEVADGKEEWLAAAAHTLADPRKSIDSVTVLRISRGDLPLLGIRVEEDQFGDTGVPHWDRRHRNLVADRAQLLRLVQLLAERCHQGHDHLRRIEKQHVERALNVICNYPPCRCPPHVRMIAQWRQLNSNARPARPDLLLDQITQEVAVVEFDDEVIRPGAERLSRDDQVRDWYDSLNALRCAYAASYLPTLADRFQLRESRHV